MKKIIILSFGLITAITSMAQTTTSSDKIIARQTLTVKTKTVDSIQTAGEFLSDRAIPSSKAVQDNLTSQLSSLAFVDTLYKVGDSLTWSMAGRNHTLMTSGNTQLAASNGGTDIFQLPANGITTGLTTFTKYGAAASSTVTAVGAYDQIKVIGGDATSIFELDQRQFALGESIIRLKVKIDSLGANPLLGIKERDVPSGVYSNWTGFDYSGSVSLLDGHWTIPAYSRGATVDSSNNFYGVPLAVGDVVDIVYHKIYAGFHRIIIYKNGLLMKSSFANINCLAADGGGGDNHCFEGFIMADGKYTILNYSIKSPYSNPLLAIIGDSLGSGARIESINTLQGWFNRLTPYKCALMGGPSSYLAGALACEEDVIKVRPKYVLMMLNLDGIWQDFCNPTNGNYATWDKEFKRYVSNIRAAGAIPIFPQYTSTALVLSATNCLHWNDYLDAQFPGSLRLDLRGKTFTYDGTAFHFDSNTNKMIVGELIKILQADNAFVIKK
jgi:hypothetical protein